MDIISDLPHELLVTILSYLPTKIAVSTSILSKRWQFHWMWLPKLDYNYGSEISPELNDTTYLNYRNFVDKTLPLHRAPVIQRLHLELYKYGLHYSEGIKQCIGTHRLRELSISVSCCYYNKPDVVLPSSLYTSKSLVSLTLEGGYILVDVPQMVSLPSLKTLKLREMKYSNQDSLQLLLSRCPVLEDLAIDREMFDNLEPLAVTVPSLQRLSVSVCTSDSYVIVTPSLKYFKLEDIEERFSYSIEYMPKLEEADISVVIGMEKVLKSVTSVKRLSLSLFVNTAQESVYDSAGIVFNQLEHLRLCICGDGWSKLLMWMLRNSPKLRVLSLYVDTNPEFDEYQPFSWDKSSVPECLMRSLKTLKFAGYKGRPEERDFLYFIFKTCHLKYRSIFDSGNFHAEF